MILNEPAESDVPGLAEYSFDYEAKSRVKNVQETQLIYGIISCGASRRAR